MKVIILPSVTRLIPRLKALGQLKSIIPGLDLLHDVASFIEHIVIKTVERRAVALWYQFVLPKLS